MLAVIDEVGDDVTVGTGVRVPDDVDVAEGVLEADPVAVPEAVGGVDAVPDVVGDADTVALGLWYLVGVVVIVAVGEGVPLADGVWLAVCESERDTVAVGDGVGVAVAVCESDCDTVGVCDGVRVPVGVPDPVGDGVRV